MPWEARCDYCKEVIKDDEVVYELRAISRKEQPPMYLRTVHWKCIRAIVMPNGV